MKNMLKNRNVGFGTRVSLLTLALLVVLVGVNILVALLPKQYTLLDSTHNGLYTLSSTTESYIKTVDDKVTVYFLCDDGAEDVRIRTFLDRYSGLNGNVTVKTIDPTKNPTFVSSYTDEPLNNYSVIVASDKRSTVLDYYDLYLWENEVLGIMNAEKYSAYLSDSYGSYILSYSETVQHFNGEAKVTNAITYVTADRIPKIYALSNHGETALPSTFKSALGESSYDVVSGVSLFSLGKVPEDCDLLLINTPTSDLSVREAEWISDYLKEGGRLLLTTAAGKNYVPYEEKDTDGNKKAVPSDFPNLLSVLQKYGLSAQNDVIVEKDSSMSYADYPRILLPSRNTAHPIISGASGNAMMFYDAHGITLDRSVPGVTLTTLFSTSSSAYTVKKDAENASDRTEESQDGPFTVGAASESGDTRVVWFASMGALDDTVDQLVSGGNYAFAVSACDWLTEKEASVAIPSISLEEPKLVITADSLTVFSIFFTAVIPLSVLIGGFVYWMRRRRA